MLFNCSVNKPLKVTADCAAAAGLHFQGRGGDANLPGRRRAGPRFCLSFTSRSDGPLSFDGGYAVYGYVDRYDVVGFKTGHLPLG